MKLVGEALRKELESQSPENGSQHCKEILEAWEDECRNALSQSPENGSQHCKPIAREALGRSFWRVAIP